MTVFTRTLACLALLVALGACSGTPVRHLASDASLIKPGTSTKEDVLTYLGDPDTRQTVSATAERWIYYEQQPSTLQQAPLVGKLFSAKGYDKIIVTFEGESVVECRFSSLSADEFNWADDYSWQEKRE